MNGKPFALRSILICSIMVALNLTGSAKITPAQSSDIPQDPPQSLSADSDQEKDKDKKDDKKDEKKDEKKGLPLKSERKVSFTTDEGTWLSLDVSPDGKTIAFEPLGSRSAKSGDFVFTYGRAVVDGSKQGGYTRIWQNSRAGWKLVLDQVQVP